MNCKAFTTTAETINRQMGKKLLFFALILLASPLWGDGRGAAQTANETGAGNALEYNGVSNSVDYGNLSVTNFGTNNFSIEMWIQTPSTRWEAVMTKRTGACVHSNFWEILLTNTGTIRAVLDQDAGGTNFNSAVGSIPVNTGKFHHVAVVRSGVNLSVYIDGVLDVSNSTAGVTNLSNSAKTFLGSEDGACIGSWQHFTGQVDEVRIWNRALTQSEIQTNMCRKLSDNYGNGLVGYWRFDEGTDNTCSGGQDACDASGNGNHGTKF